MKHIIIFILAIMPIIATPQATTTFWEDDCETTTGWTNSGAGTWGISSDQNYQGTYCFETAPGVSYSGSQTSYRLTSPAIDISDYTQCKLSVFMKIETEEEYDGGYVEVSSDNGVSWSKMYNAQMNIPYDGKLSQLSTNVLGTNLAWYNNLDWTELIVDLSEFEGSTAVKFRFSFGSDDATEFRGMFIDQASIYGYAKTTIHNSDGANQLVFDNSFQYITDPMFSVSSDVASSFNRFKVEINKSPQFSDISHIQEFGGGVFSRNTVCANLQPTEPGA